MKKNIFKLTEYLNQKSNFLGWLFFVLVIDYLFLFFIETILPGFVTEVFNLNFLLLLIVILWVILMSFVKKQVFSIKVLILRIVLIASTILIGVALFFVLYKASFLESLIYLLFIFISGYFLYDYLKQKIIS